MNTLYTITLVCLRPLHGTALFFLKTSPMKFHLELIYSQIVHILLTYLKKMHLWLRTPAKGLCSCVKNIEIDCKAASD